MENHPNLDYKVWRGESINVNTPYFVAVEF